MKKLIIVILALFILASMACAEPKNNDELFKAVNDAGKLLGQGKYNEVIALLENNLPADIEGGMSNEDIATLGIGYNNIGIAYLKIAKFDRAIISINRCREILPKWSAPYYLLGQAYYEYGLFKESVTNFNKGMELEPAAADCRDYSYLMASYISLNDRASAEKVLELAKKRFPDQAKSLTISGLESGLSKGKDTNTYMRQAEICYQRKDYNGEIENYRNIIRIDPNHKVAHYNLGKCLLTIGKNDDGIAECEKAIALGLDNINVYRALGKEYLKKKEEEKALKMYENIKRLNPNDDSAYFTCGVLYLGSRDIPKAREDFKKAVELNPNNVEAHYELGWLYTDYKPVYARQELEKALKLNPSHSGAKKELERLNNKNK